MTNPQPTNCHWCGTGCMTSHQFRDSSKASQLCCVPSKSDRLIQLRLHASSPACPPDCAQANDRCAIHYLVAPANQGPEQQATCMVDKHEQWKGGGRTQQEMSGGGGMGWGGMFGRRHLYNSNNVATFELFPVRQCHKSELMIQFKSAACCSHSLLFVWTVTQTSQRCRSAG